METQGKLKRQGTKASMSAAMMLLAAVMAQVASGQPPRTQRRGGTPPAAETSGIANLHPPCGAMENVQGRADSQSEGWANPYGVHCA